jgi:hypothetical protein
MCTSLYKKKHARRRFSKMCNGQDATSRGVIRPDIDNAY